MGNKRVSILIVEDHETTRRALALLVSSFLTVKHDCSTVATAEEALMLLESWFFHLVLVDIKLPGASGLDLTSLIQRQYPNTVVILVSGAAGLRDMKGRLMSRCFDCIDKTANVQELKDSIRRALEFQESIAGDRYHLPSL
jgi:two-component system C4-dicarboxylate transport response regulator DctD